VIVIITLNLASNPYICDCCLIWFIKWLNNTKIIIQEYPENYYCVMPESWKGKLLNTFSKDCTEQQNLTVIFQQYYLQLISQLENLYNVCTTYVHVLPLEQELVFRVPNPCLHHNKLRIHHIHNPYY
jgi:phenolic acid decarboxylase